MNLRSSTSKGRNRKKGETKGGKGEGKERKREKNERKLGRGRKRMGEKRGTGRASMFGGKVASWC